MRIELYRNNRNHNKYIEVKHTNDRHYMWRQYMEWSNGVKNYTLKAYRRMSKKVIRSVLEDYSFYALIKED